MAITEVFSGTTTAVGTTEYYFTSNSTTQSLQTTSGVYCCFVDLMNLAVGDIYQISIWEKVISSDAVEQVMIDTVTGPVDSQHYVTPALGLMHGWTYSIRKLTGTDRTFTFSIRQLG